MSHVAQIVARVQAQWPNDTRKQRRAIERWARLIEPLEPGIAERLMDFRLVGSANDSRKGRP